MIYVVLISSVLFTITDFLARSNLAKSGFTYHILSQPWFIVYCLLRLTATACQLYVFSSVELGKTAALFGAISIVFSNLIGLLLLKEVLSVSSYIGILLAVSAFTILAVAK
jgi:hypothetical protein